jgi:hypothetical protein
VSGLKDIGSALLQVAPSIAGLFGGPLASMGVVEAEKVFGLTPAPDATIDARQAAVMGAMATATPDQLIALKNADNALTSKLADAGVQLEQIAAADRASARTANTTAKDWTPRILAAIIVLGWLGIQWFLLTQPLQAGSTDLIARLLSTLDNALMLVLGYYYGTSAGSADKNAMLSKAIDSANK